MKPLLLALLPWLMLPHLAGAAEYTVVGKPTELGKLPQQTDISPTTVMTWSDSRTFLETGAPNCKKGTRRVSFEQGRFEQDGKSMSADEVIAVLKRQSLGKRPSCLYVESQEYDRDMFMKLSMALVSPLSVSLFWKKPSS